MQADDNQEPKKRRRDAGARTTERDMVVLKCCGEQYASRFDQVQVLLGRMPKAETKLAGLLSESATRHTIDRWEELKYVVCKRVLDGGPKFVWLTRASLHAVGLPFRMYTPAPAELSHIYWCMQARLYCERHYPDHEWQSERWMRYELDQKMKRVSLPDALLYPPDAGSPLAVEVELRQKNKLRLEEILRDRTLVYARVWYFAPPAVRYALLEARDQLEELYQQRVTIQPLEDLL
jgi:hypothetical protein